jgi:hypothetical protein
MRNRLSSKALNPQKTSADLEAEGKWLPFELFIEAIEALQRECDAAIDSGDDISSASRLMHDLCLLRIYQACPSRSGEIRQLEFVDSETLDNLRGRKVLSRYVLDSRRNILTRRPLSCFSMHIGKSKTTKHMGVSSTDFQEVCYHIRYFLIPSFFYLSYFRLYFLTLIAVCMHILSNPTIDAIFFRPRTCIHSYS